jgi:glucokinase
MDSARIVVGVDVGGTKIAAGIADGGGKAIACRRAATAEQGGSHVVSQIVRLLERLIADSNTDRDRIPAIGIAVPAVIDRGRERVLWAPNIAGWQTPIEVAGPVREALAIRATVHYDGHAWAMGEWWRGAAQGARDAALVAVGTGIGGGLILGGRLHEGRVGVAGALGWWVTDWREGGSARKPGVGRLEALASGPAIASAAGRDSAAEVFEAARSGDARSQRAVADAARALGAAVASLVSLVDPEVVVLVGGVIAGGADLLLPQIRDIVRCEAQPQMARDVRVVSAALGEDAAWLGAAKLAADATEETEEAH